MYNNLSIVIAAYNSERTINTAINSILHLLDNGTKLIFVDDGSTDLTVEIVKSFAHKNIIILQNKENYGVGYSKNLGMSQIKTPYLSFMDADDWVTKTYYFNMLSYILEHPQVDFVRCGYVLVENKKRSIKFPIVNKYFTYITQDEYIGSPNKSTLIDFALMPCSIIKYEFVKKNNISCEEFRSNEDRVFWWNVALNDFICVVLPEFGYFYDKSPNKSALTQTGNLSQISFIDAQNYILNKVRKSENINFINKAVRQSIALIDFHFKNKERLQDDIRDLLIEKSKKFIQNLTEDEMKTVYSSVSNDRKKLLNMLSK